MVKGVAAPTLGFMGHNRKENQVEQKISRTKRKNYDVWHQKILKIITQFDSYVNIQVYWNFNGVCKKLGKVFKDILFYIGFYWCIIKSVEIGESVENFL